MTGPFGIAAVSAVLRRLVSRGLGDVDLSIFGGNATTVSAHPPDQIQVGANEPAQLNLFLYRVTPNAALRNDALPSRGPNGDRLTNPWLALDLHYLLTAYGASELFPEALLGYGMQVLHEVPFLSRDYIRNTWPGGGNDPVEQALAASGLADQIEYIKLTPETLSTEELSKLWTAFQAKYRPSAGFLASVVLIQENRSTRATLPVLKQGDAGTGPTAVGTLVPPYPGVDAVKLPRNQRAAVLGDAIQVVGHDFAGTSGDPAGVTVVVRLRHARFPIVRDVTVPPGSRADNEVRFQFPDDAANLPVGLYGLSLIVTPEVDPTRPRESNVSPLLLAPHITTALPATVNAGPITLSVTPEVRPGQDVSLGIGAQQIPAAPIQNQGSDVSFDLTGIEPGTYQVRLRVDLVDSLFEDRSDPSAPKFDPTQQIKVQ